MSCSRHAQAASGASDSRLSPHPSAAHGCSSEPVLVTKRRCPVPAGPPGQGALLNRHFQGVKPPGQKPSEPESCLEPPGFIWPLPQAATSPLLPHSGLLSWGESLFFLKIHSFISLFGCGRSLSLRRPPLWLSGVGAPSHRGQRALHRSAFSCLELRLQMGRLQQVQRVGSRAQPHSPRHVGSSWPRITREQTGVRALQGGLITTGPPGTHDRFFLKLSPTCRPVKILRRQTRAAAPRPS